MKPREIEVFLHSFLKAKKDKKFLLAVSGGIDSMGLLYSFAEISKKLKLNWSVAHIHHGHGSDLQQNQYRDNCHQFVQDVCQKSEIDFLSNISNRSEADRISIKKDSEAGLRAYRHQQLKVLVENESFDFLVFAHHADDLLETRLIRMLRGTGPQGLQSMSPEKGMVLRPLLGFTKIQIADYLQILKQTGKSIVWLEDPSNSSSRYLRNWLRNRWLPALEKVRPGAMANLSQSMESMVAAIEQSPSLEGCFEEGRLLRSEYVGLTLSDKRRVLGLLLKQQGFNNYGLSHINELIKRLDVEQKELTFKMLKKIWLANARHIWCE